MRNTFIDELTLLAARDPRIFLVVGDLGFSVIEPFAEQFPDRFLNAGVAEQNMTGVAAGLAMAGYKVFTYSIANFPTLRCLEQIRNDVCYHNLDVTVVAVGGGLGYGSLGYSHHAVQDIACLRTMPGMRLLLPGCPSEVRAATRWQLENPGPSYLRLGKGGEPDFGPAPTSLSPGPRLIHLGHHGHHDHSSKALLAIGNSLGWTGPLAEAEGAAVYSLAIWDDSDLAQERLRETISQHDKVIVVEEHLQAGGAGSLIREALEHHPDLQRRIRCLHLSAQACDRVGSADHIRHAAGLTPASVRSALQV